MKKYVRIMRNWTIYILFGTVLLTIFGIAVKMVFLIFTGEFDGSEGDSSILLTIFSIIVTFWVGINIYNSLDKNEVYKNLDRNKQMLDNDLNIMKENLTQQYEVLESKTEEEIKKIDERNEKTCELLEDVEKESVGLTNTLQKVLFRSALDRQNTWYELFYEFSEELQEKINPKSLCTIIEIEELYNRTYRIYYTGEYFHYLQDYSTQGLELVQKVNKTLFGLEKSKWRDIYLVIRESDFLFFRAIYYKRERNVSKFITDLSQSIERLKVINELFNSGEIANLSNLCLTKHYNTLAYSYLLLFEVLEYESFLQEARKWALESTQRQDKKIVYPTSFRHLGNIQEKLGNLEEAMSFYEKILALFPEDSKTLYCSYSAILKYVNCKIQKGDITDECKKKLNNAVKDLEKISYKDQDDFQFKNLLLFGYTLQFYLAENEKKVELIEMIKRFLEKNSDHKGLFDPRFRADNLNRLVDYQKIFDMDSEWVNSGRGL